MLEENSTSHYVTCVLKLIVQNLNLQ